MTREREPEAAASTVMRGVTVAALASVLGAKQSGDPHALVTGVQQDSRRVMPGDLFVALAGAHAHGAGFVHAAVAAGATAVMLEEGVDVHVDIPVLWVRHPRRALADAAATVHGRPTEELHVVGITGTNGKTTTAQLARYALSSVGARIGVVGTLGYAFEDLALDATHTSPEADALQHVARLMRDKGAEDLVMEVSSIALAAERVRATRFEVAVFTNLTQDHLDYHGSMERYAAEKDRLFLEHAPPVSIINVDDAHGRELADNVRSRTTRLITVSAEGRPATVRALSTAHTLRGIELDIVVGEEPHRLVAPLIGDHNAANLLMVVAIAHGLGRDVAGVVASLAHAPGVPGRLERCDTVDVDDVLAVVDYAHTPDALARALASLRPFTSGRVWCVFGCGGDRDAKKRAPMGVAVGRAADVAIVTNDNPRGESPQAIADAIVAGLVAAADPSVEHEVELDRRRAIERAILGAAPGDVVLVAGKGHETYQIIGANTLPFDDREAVRAALTKRRGS